MSQFTLYGRLKKPKPDFSKAMGPSEVRRQLPCLHLHASLARKGRRCNLVAGPWSGVAFSPCALPAQARDFYASFVSLVQESYAPDKVQDGVFGAMMDVALVNDG